MPDLRNIQNLVCSEKKIEIDLMQLVPLYKQLTNN